MSEIRDLIEYTVMPETRLDALANLMSAAPLKGCFVQCGVGNGGSAATMAVADIAVRQYFLFDSFEGMPWPGPNDERKAFRNWHPDWCKGDPEKVREIFGKLNLPDPTIIIGMIQDTLPLTATGPIAILHIDVDWYEATKLTLVTLAPRVVIGGLIIVDDYGHWDGARKACDDYFSVPHRRDVYGRCQELLPGDGDPTRFWMVR